MPICRLLYSALLLALAAPASAQMDTSLKMDCFEKLLASLDEGYQTQGDTPSMNVIELPNDNFYVEVRGTGKKGIQPSGGLGDGDYFISNEGEATDCNADPEDCRELISDAVNGGGETTTSAEPPPGNEPATESLPGGAPAYHYEFQRHRNGTLVFSMDRRLRGLWGYRFEPRLCD